MSKKTRKQWFANRNKTRQNNPPELTPAIAKNSNIVNPRTGMGGVQDRSRGMMFGQAWWCADNPLVSNLNRLGAGRTLFDLYNSDWAANKIVDIPVDDTYREGFNITYKGKDTGIDKMLQEEWDRLDLTTERVRARKLERLTGGAAMILGVSEKSTPDSDNTKPLDIKSLEKGCLRFVNVVSRYAISARQWQTNPMQSDYGRPLTYTINGNEVHRSRLVILDGEPLSRFPGLDFGSMVGDNDGFGYSVLAPIWNQLVRAEVGQQSAIHLMMMASVLIATSTKHENYQTNRAGQKAISDIQHFVETINMFKAYVTDDSIDIKQIAASFGSVPELIHTFEQMLAAAGDIPAERFLSESIGGIGDAGGSARLENYYNKIRAEQVTRESPQITNDIFPLLIQSAFGPNDYEVKDFEIEWPRLWNMSDMEKAQADTLNTNNFLNIKQALGVRDDDIMAELVRKEVIEKPLQIDPQMAMDFALEEYESAYRGGTEDGQEFNAPSNIRVPTGGGGIPTGQVRAPSV